MEQRKLTSWRDVLLHALLTVLLQAGLGAVIAINGILLAGIARWYPLSCAAFVTLVLVILYSVGAIPVRFFRDHRTRAGRMGDIENARRKFSRWMPPLAHKPLRWYETLILFPLFAALVVVICAMYLLLAPLVVYLFVRDNRQRAALLEERKGEDIGTFARSFDRRSTHFDSWVIRATWDALMVYLDYPIRASDRIDDLGIEPDDIFFCVIPEIMERSGHVLDAAQPDTHPGRETVGDLVLWVSSLKRVENAARSA